MCLLDQEKKKKKKKKKIWEKLDERATWKRIEHVVICSWVFGCCSLLKQPHAKHFNSCATM